MVSSLIVMDLHVYLPDVADVLPGETYAVHFDVYIDGTMHTVSDTFLAGGSVTPSEVSVHLCLVAKDIWNVSYIIAFITRCTKLILLYAVLCFSSCFKFVFGKHKR